MLTYTIRLRAENVFVAHDAAKLYGIKFRTATMERGVIQATFTIRADEECLVKKALAQWNEESGYLAKAYRASIISVQSNKGVL